MKVQQLRKYIVSNSNTIVGKELCLDLAILYILSLRHTRDIKFINWISTLIKFIKISFGKFTNVCEDILIVDLPCRLCDRYGGANDQYALRYYCGFNPCCSTIIEVYIYILTTIRQECVLPNCRFMSLNPKISHFTQTK